MVTVKTDPVRIDPKRSEKDLHTGAFLTFSAPTASFRFFIFRETGHLEFSEFGIPMMQKIENKHFVNRLNKTSDMSVDEKQFRNILKKLHHPDTLFKHRIHIKPFLVLSVEIATLFVSQEQVFCMRGKKVREQYKDILRKNDIPSPVEVFSLSQFSDRKWKEFYFCSNFFIESLSQSFFMCVLIDALRFSHKKRNAFYPQLFQ